MTGPNFHDPDQGRPGDFTPLVDAQRVEHPIAGRLRQWAVDQPGNPDVIDLVLRAAALIDDQHHAIEDVMFYLEKEDGDVVSVACEPEPDETCWEHPIDGWFCLLPAIDGTLHDQMNRLLREAK